MQNNTPFTIYNASAGSGKTYTLVKEYLKILFQSKKREPFKHILAITFTNKAVAEMKDRIIETLKAFSDASILQKNDSMFLTLCEELNMEKMALHTTSKTLLQNIIHNYAAFDISTIDGFTHKLIRTFAHDLKLPLNFEVELDQNSLLNEAVDGLISRAGINKELTKVLVDFAIEKADDDKSWDVAFDFNKIAKLLVNENDIPFIESLKDKTVEDFNSLKKHLKQLITGAEESILTNANAVLNLIAECGLEFNDFSRSTLPNHFKKASELDLDRLYENKLEENITERKGIYTKALKADLANTIDSIMLEIELFYKTVKLSVYHLKFLKSFYRNITPLSVLNAINKELTALKEDQNKMLISEFNTIISSEIKNQPTPFIYERIGEKFNHYFIDEFQDTSVLQWENLKPLIENSLSKEHGTAMLVGDAKQSIYRWRGGKAEQFIDLFNEKDVPFPIKQEVYNLPTNFRSFKEIVSFNNGFFKFLSTQVFANKDYELLYEKAPQNHFLKQDGYVNISFLEMTSDDDRDTLFCKKIFETINTCLERDFKLKDICVLVRKNKEGVAIANYLSQLDIPIISSETLLIYNAPEVQFVTNMLQFLIHPKNNEIKAAVLNYLCELFNVDDKHEFIKNRLPLSVNEVFKTFEAHDVYLDPNTLIQLSLFDLAETIVRAFRLIETSNAYIQFYLDLVLDFNQKKGSDIAGFLEYFDKKKDSLSIVSPHGQNAIQIMTIHKSKGLEFPVVIFPYADLNIYSEIEPKEWFPLEKEAYQGFSHTLLNFTKDFEHFGDDGFEIYNKHQSEQELDNINLLYVTLTRAIEQLYIISKKDISSKGVVNEKRFSGLFINYLKALGVWNDSDETYAFGNPKKTSEETKKETFVLEEQEFISNTKEDHNIKIVTNAAYLWDSSQENAIEKGNLIHNIMSRINTKDDIDMVLKDFLETSKINEAQSEILKTLVIDIVEHPKLRDFFNAEHTIYNERDIITETGQILRPDRIVINSKQETTIIDYKTGKEDKAHAQQLISYQDILESMNLTVVKKILIYINDSIDVKEV